MTVLALLTLLGDALRRGQPPKEVPVAITSLPEKARLRIDGKEYNPTNCTVALRANTRYVVELDKPGYESLRQQITVGGEPQRLQFELAELPPLPRPLQRVIILAEPGSPAIRIDGQAVGRGHAVVNLDSGQHALRIELAGYQTREDQFEVVDQPLHLQVTLEPALCRLTIETQPRQATVYFADRLLAGSSPFLVETCPGKYVVRTACAGYRTDAQEVDVNRDARVAIELTPDAAPAAADVWIETEPRGASIDIDGQPLTATTPAKLSLLQGVRRVILSRPGYASIRADFSVAQDDEIFCWWLDRLETK